MMNTLNQHTRFQSNALLLGSSLKMGSAEPQTKDDCLVTLVCAGYAGKGKKCKKSFDKHHRVNEFMDGDYTTEKNNKSYQEKQSCKKTVSHS
jgi:hypothetical protein